MKFHNYLQLLHNYLGADKTRADFVLYITDLFLKEPSTQAEINEDENDKYNPLSALTKRTLEKIYSGEDDYKLSKVKAKKLKSKYDPSKFSKEIMESLSESVVKKLTAELKQNSISAQANNYERICADIYYSFLGNLSKGNDCIDERFYNSVPKSPILKKQAKQVDNYSSEAISFCKSHEKKLPLIPLCLVANNSFLIQKNARKLYNEFSLYSEDTKKAICQLTGFDYIQFKENWITKCIDLFIDDVKKYQLGERPFLYDNGKYLHSALNFRKSKIKSIDPFVFEPLFPGSKTNSSLTSYIREYLYHSNDHPDRLMPIDMVWKRMKLETCSLKKMSFWVMRIIISCIYQMPIGEYEDNMTIDETYIETYEDMYYYTLLVLYSRYKNHI